MKPVQSTAGWIVGIGCALMAAAAPLAFAQEAAPDLPPFILPDETPADPAVVGGLTDEWARRIVATNGKAAEAAVAEDPSHRVIEMIRGRIAERYVADDGDIDLERVSALLSGDYLGDYTRERQMDGPVQFSNGVFSPAIPDASEPPEPAPSAPASEGFSDFILSPEAIRAMSQMSPDQIEAIALMAQMMKDPESANINPQRDLGGVPSLSDELAGRSPEELLAELSEDAPRQPRVVDVGNGRDVTLEGWEVTVDATGAISVGNVALPGSGFEVAVGTVVGQFGRVTEISSIPGDIYVEFETGDRIAGRQASLTDGVPALDLSDEPVTGGEILVSGAAPGAETDTGAPEEAVQAEMPSSPYAPVSSPRPQPRSRRL
ncbi:hypothetical protein [Defluviimonas salinarum]|uniref:Uncharacterized protein n=1 Tax=Defluviimonas salinarum TaxID=2992147 RepID=A0ABT3J4G4_9RHOB|nr:hypothetical protein [Defluviimonas salinarum]MCW3782568.1 hypothetical protein [Defluviimonas salinarum]